MAGEEIFHRNQPRVNSRTNDNQCLDRYQLRLLAGSTPRQTLTLTHVNSPVVSHVLSATGQPQRKGLSPGLTDVNLKECQLKYVKSVSSVIPLSCVNPAINAPHAVPNRPVGSRLQIFWQIWEDLGAGPKVVQMLKQGYTLPFWTRPNLSRFPTVVSQYVNPHRNSYLLEALQQLIDKNAIELVRNQSSLGFFN